jgi:hypothetical protein
MRSWMVISRFAGTVDVTRRPCASTVSVITLVPYRPTLLACCVELHVG